VRNGFASVSFESLITAALLGHLYHQGRFWQAASRYARVISRRRAPNLADDLHDDIVSEAIVQLLSAGAAGLEKRSGLQLFRIAVLRAIRKVRADNTAPGVRTRSGAYAEVGKVAPEQVENIIRLPDAPSEVTAINLDAVAHPDAGRAVQDFETRTDAERILAAATAPLATALRLIHFHDQPMHTVADMQGIDRVTLYRRLQKFSAQWRLAA
jgi:DNA-directed RNA polymerase specialized sigma24 family protein